MTYNSPFGRKKEVSPLEDAFKDLLKAYRLEDTYQEKLLISSWPELVGKTIADRTSGLYIKEKKLFVKITSGPIKKELQLSKSKVLGLIETQVGKGIVEEVVFL
jgi:predicted nucleic acid-binding Zn ribbon protein